MKNKLNVIEENGQLLVDSREVAEMVEKRHADLVRSIESYLVVIDQNAKLRSDDFFIESTYQAGTGKLYKQYLLTKKGCDLVANKMTGDKGISFTAQYVSRFEEMEKALKARSSLIDTYLGLDEEERAIAYFTERKAKRELQAQLSLVEPKVEKYNQFLDADGLMKIGQLAKVLCIKGMGQNNLFKYLRENNILMSGTNKNVPYQKYVDRGFFQVKTQETNIGIKTITLVTPKGADFIADLLANREAV
ncbi:phage antirepressor KilAC domain-containing protein [Bacillus altitudinis]|uniref:phage antirepressor KilAC domain-containing protein n=1 Tax=Bacillus altitudinis TaxID=293387 RepID=UPI00227EFF22|nr:phage antirepressor KilAC domain-containing protein [Bacillus altitudinis]MCY7627767.1 phage antirepressor KilAC domain-containing protein [Bacillus altitudinis]MDX2363647.1 phage antirepressor KilAC domain-containing protein [Bacillus altitudinis]